MNIDISEAYDDNGICKWRYKKINNINELLQHIDYWLITRPHETRGILYTIKFLINLCDIRFSNITIIPNKKIFRIILVNHKIWEYISLLPIDNSFMDMNIVDVNGRFENFIFGPQDIDTKIKIIYREYNVF